MKLLQRAINYETLVTVLRKADSYVIPLFDTVGSLCSLDEPLTDHLKAYLDVVTVPSVSLEEAYKASVQAFKVLEGMGDLKIIDYTSPLFPKQATRTIPFLYLRGNENLLGKIGLCIVGTRNPSEHGVELTRQVADAAGCMGLTIISGLAMGVDGVAHIQALSKGFDTIGVIGTPINQTYPKEHEKLQEYIAHRGLLVSMFAPTRQVQKYYFLQRDELMAMIGHGSFVTEANDGGGAVKQAKYSEGFGKNVFILRETYENRTFLWPRGFKNPVVLSDPKLLKYSFDRDSKQGTKQNSSGADNKDSQLSLF